MCLLAQSDKVRVCETGGGGAQMELKHEGAGMLFRQWDVNSLFKSGIQYWCTVSQSKKIIRQQIPHNYRLRMAESRVQGMFVAPSTNTPSLLFPTPVEQSQRKNI